MAEEPKKVDEGPYFLDYLKDVKERQEQGEPIDDRAKMLLEMNLYESLFQNLPALDANVDYEDQSELL